MKGLRTIRLLMVIALLAVSLASATTAQADTPYTEEEIIDDVFAVDNPCGFEITGHTWGTGHIRVYFDQDGNIARYHYSFGQLDETWSANGKTQALQISGPIHLTVISEANIIVAQVGAGEVMTLPHYGRVYGRAGTYATLYDYTTDPWTYLGITKEVGAPWIENWDAICEYFAP